MGFEKAFLFECKLSSCDMIECKRGLDNDVDAMIEDRLVLQQLHSLVTLNNAQRDYTKMATITTPYFWDRHLPR